MKTRISLTLAITLLAPGMALAADAGAVLFATGSVMADREPPVALAKGDAVLDNDTISTAAASRAQLLMIDGAKIAIRPNSVLRIDEYAYASGQTQAVVSTSQEKGVMSLVKGGFRTITGAIGKQDRNDYEVRTPVGVLGIRGTDYALLFCSADCGWAPGVRPGEPIEDGLYIGVNDGAISFVNEAGEIVLYAGEYAFIPLVSRVPERLDVPPPGLIDFNDLSFDDAGATLQPDDDKDDTRSGFDSQLATRRSTDTKGTEPDDTIPREDTEEEVPQQPIIGVDSDGMPVDLTSGEAPPPPPVADDRPVTYSTGPLGRVTQVFSGVLINTPADLQLDANSDVTGFAGPFPNAVGADIADFRIGTSANVDTGFDAMRVLRWGRWAGGVADGTLRSDGSGVTVDLNNQSLHWVAGPDLPPPVMPITGVATYTLIGATAPTDNLGNTGVLGSATFQADFTAMQVDSTLVIDIAGSTWSAAGTGNIGAAANLPAHLFDGSYGNVDVDGIGGGSGLFSGFFSDPGATTDPTFPGGVGLTFSLRDAANASVVSGSAVFGDP